jgi:hypothetical protein
LDRFRFFPAQTFARPAPLPAFARFVVMKDFKFVVCSKILHAGSIPITTAWLIVPWNKEKG